MPITTTVTGSSFRDAFRRIRPDQFSHEALGALYEYIVDYSDSTGEPVELDVIAICCEWAEYGRATEAASEYGFTPDADDIEDDQEAAALAWLQDQTTVLELGSGGVVIASF